MKKLTIALMVIIGLVFLDGCGSDNNADENNNPDPEPTPPGQGTSTLKKTGQTQSYDTYGDVVTDGSLKDDGYYQKGVTPSYARDDTKESVTDNVTELMWQDDEAAERVRKNWADAGPYCSNDVSTGGYSDWRLPTRVELGDLADYGRYHPAISTEFQNTDSGIYWSLTASLFGGDYSGNRWIVNFYTGAQADEDETSSYPVRCVRGEESGLSEDGRFSRANGVVTDSRAHLQWQDDYSDNSGTVKTATWHGAIDYCEALPLDGGGWRAPNLNELKSLVDDAAYNPSISPVFLNTASNFYWSSTTYESPMGDAWIVNFQYGYQTFYGKTESLYVRCVRAGQ